MCIYITLHKAILDIDIESESGQGWMYVSNAVEWGSNLEVGWLKSARSDHDDPF